jgi:sugar lactone lactonase YvrE
MVAGFTSGNKVNAQCRIITTVGGTATAGYTGDGGAATSARISNPAYMLTDASCNYYIADWNNFAIRKVNSSGIISTLVGTGTSGTTGDGGAATAATITTPGGMAFDASGNFYFSDLLNNRIRKINTSGVISNFAGTGAAGNTGDGGPASAATFNRPYGIVFDAAGNMIVADQYNHRIRKISPSGTVSGFAGTGTLGFRDTSVATAAQFYYPQCLYMSSTGDLYVDDNSNHRIRKISPSGVVSTFAGNGTVGSTGDGGAATAARIHWFGGMTMDPAGNLYFAETQGNKIRYINTSGIINTIAEKSKQI